MKYIKENYLERKEDIIGMILHDVRENKLFNSNECAMESWEKESWEKDPISRLNVYHKYKVFLIQMPRGGLMLLIHTSSIVVLVFLKIMNLRTVSITFANQTILFIM